MAEPTITESGELYYARVAPIMAYDEEHEWTGRILCDALMAMFQEVDQLVLDTDGLPGWGPIFVPAACPASWLPWCGQVYGVKLPPNRTTEEQRLYIEELPAQKRGTLAAMRAAAEPTLTGAKELSLVEQAGGHAYRIVAHTVASQTPHEQITKEALESQTPAGVKLVYGTTTSPRWNETTKRWNEVANTVQWGTVETGQV